MNELGNPERGRAFIHVAGTNGKGSTAAYLSSVLRFAGYRTGLYISPYIQSFGERIRVNGIAITKDEIAEEMTKVIEAAERVVLTGAQAPTVFELVTAMGFLYFKRQNCDITVLEVGLGGRLDATNIIEAPVAAVITSVGFDHTELLGTTLTEIAGEKAGIIKPGCDVIISEEKDEVTDAVSAVCRDNGVSLFRADARSARITVIAPDGLCFDWENYKGLETRLTGLFQIKNAVNAVRTAQVLSDRGWAINETAVREGLRTASCIGRMEFLCEKPVFLADGAHNPQGAAALAGSLAAMFPGKKITFIMGVLADKDCRAILSEVFPVAKRFYTVTPPGSRALSAYELKKEISALSSVPAEAFDEIKEGISAALDAAREDDILCAFGSLYQIGRIREFFGRAESE